LVEIAADGGDGRNGREFVKNLGHAHIPRMNNVLRPAQSPQRFRPKESVSIGNEADSHCLIISKVR
jgi:hypothetical protein